MTQDRQVSRTSLPHPADPHCSSGLALEEVTPRDPQASPQVPRSLHGQTFWLGSAL